MQATTARTAVLLLVALFPCLTHGLTASQMQHAVSYAQLAPFNGQWNVAVSIARGHSGVFTPHACNTTAKGAACNMPPLRQKQGDQLRVTYTPKNTSAIRTLRNGVPDEVVVKLCYATVSWTDRPWRKKNKAYPKYGQDCPIEVGKSAFNAAGGSETIDLDDQEKLGEEYGLPSALYYVSVCTLCDMPPGDIDGAHTYCQCDRTEAKNTVESKRIKAATGGHIAAAIVLAVSSPVIFVALYVSDAIHYKRTGRALKFFRDT